MAIYTVTVGSDIVEIYGGLVAATSYMNTMIGTAYSAWRALAADDKARTLVAATRYIDALEWVGEATYLSGVDVTTLAWPRSDVYEADGETEVDEEDQLALVEQAVFELAAILAADPSALDASTAGGGAQIASVSAGGASVSYFETGEAFASTLPTRVDRLLGRWLVDSEADPGIIVSYGQTGDEVSGFAEAADYDYGKVV